jgi:hypothetical protein
VACPVDELLGLLAAVLGDEVIGQPVDVLVGEPRGRQGLAGIVGKQACTLDLRGLWLRIAGIRCLSSPDARQWSRRVVTVVGGQRGSRIGSWFCLPHVAPPDDPSGCLLTPSRFAVTGSAVVVASAKLPVALAGIPRWQPAGSADAAPAGERPSRPAGMAPKLYGRDALRVSASSQHRFDHPVGTLVEALVQARRILQTAMVRDDLLDRVRLGEVDRRGAQLTGLVQPLGHMVDHVDLPGAARREL